jgi:hypothetical protein
VNGPDSDASGVAAIGSEMMMTGME